MCKAAWKPKKRLRINYGPMPRLKQNKHVRKVRFGWSRAGFKSKPNNKPFWLNWSRKKYWPKRSSSKLNEPTS